MRVFLYGFVFLPFVLTAQSTPPPSFVDVTAPPLTLGAGQSGEGKVVLEVKEGFHVQANPAASARLVATTLDVPASSGLRPGKPLYPPGQVYRMKAGGAPLSVYGGKVEIRLPISAEKNAKPGKRQLSGKLRYQACNEETCFFPVNAKVEIPVEIK